MNIWYFLMGMAMVAALFRLVERMNEFGKGYMDELSCCMTVGLYVMKSFQEIGNALYDNAIIIII